MGGIVLDDLGELECDGDGSGIERHVAEWCGKTVGMRYGQAA